MWSAHLHCGWQQVCIHRRKLGSLWRWSGLYRHPRRWFLHPGSSRSRSDIRPDRWKRRWWHPGIRQYPAFAVLSWTDKPGLRCPSGYHNCAVLHRHLSSPGIRGWHLEYRILKCHRYRPAECRHLDIARHMFWMRCTRPENSWSSCGHGFPWSGHQTSCRQAH